MGNDFRLVAIRYKPKRVLTAPRQKDLVEDHPITVAISMLTTTIEVVMTRQNWAKTARLPCNVISFKQITKKNRYRQ